MSKILLACCLVCLPLRHLQITSRYGYRVHPITGRYTFHKGIDLRARSDTVFAVLPGTVMTATYDHLLGFYVRLDHSDFQTLYGHLSQVFVLAGDSVTAGLALGITGISGRVTGEHLHFSVSYHQQAIDPVKFLVRLSNLSLHADSGKSIKPGDSRRLPGGHAGNSGGKY
jgi:murein DD-endopeptidase MepM/ murein hydrolase activator NlpD